MRYRNVRNLIIEGPDGVGKSTLIDGLFKHYNYKYMCYHRGELSNKLFAAKFNRSFYETQRGLPFLYIVLIANKKCLTSRIIKRAELENWTEEQKQKELETVKYSNEYFNLADEMKLNYDICIINTSDRSDKDVLNEVIHLLDFRELNDAEELKCDFS